MTEDAKFSALVVRQTKALLTAKLKNLRGKKHGNAGRLILNGCLALLILVGAYQGGLRGAVFLWNLDRSDPRFGLLLLRAMLSLSTLFLLTLLFVSSLVSSLNTFYLAKDLRLMLALPLNPVSFYTARLAEVCFQSGWVILPTFMATLWGVGQGIDASLLYYLSVPIVCGLAIFAACALSVLLVTLISCLVPANRLREFSIVFNGFLVVGLYVAIRSARLERYLNPNEFRHLPSALKRFGSDQQWLPSQWMTESLISATGHAQSLNFTPLLYLTALFLFSVGAGFAVHRVLYSKARGKAVVTSSAQVQNRGEFVVTLFTLLGRTVGFRGLDLAMLKKEARTVVRDPQQWTQMFMFVGLFILFGYNFRYLNELNLPEFIEILFSLGMTGFILCALSLRFIYPLISLEGDAFWIIRSAPISAKDILRSKAKAAFLAAEIVAVMMALGASWALEFSVTGTILNLVLVTPMTVLACFLGVGLGGSYPRFSFENPLMIPMSQGGMIFMYWSLGTLFLYCLAWIWPLYAFLNPLVMTETIEKILTYALALVAGVIPLVSAWIGFKMGCNRVVEALEG